MIAGRIPQVGIVMSNSENLPRVEPAGRFLRDLDIPFQMAALSAYATPDLVRKYRRIARLKAESVAAAAAEMQEEAARFVSTALSAAHRYAPAERMDVTDEALELEALLEAEVAPSAR